MTADEFAQVFTEDLQERYLAELRQGMRRGAAVDEVFRQEGEDPDPERRRCVREFIDIDGDFQIRVLDAELEATENVEESLYQAAVSGSVSAAKTWLDLQGRGVAPQVAQRAPVASPPPVSNFDDLDNVSAIDPRRNRGA